MKTKFLLLITALSVAVAYAGDVERKAFAVSLPNDWTEDTKGKRYDPETNLLFENSESCIVMIVIGTKSAGPSTDRILAVHKEIWAKRLTQTEETKIEKWGKHEGKGFELTGNLNGTPYKARFFGFENAKHTCVVMEFADVVDAKKFTADFDRIRETFRLK